MDPDSFSSKSTRRLVTPSSAASPLPADQGATGAERPPQAAELWVSGKVISKRYVIQGVLGRGGFGTVYGAQELKSHRVVVIKVLARERSGSAWRFRRASRLLCELQHPGFIAGLGAGRAEGLDYLVMEHLPKARDLEEILEAGPLPWTEACQIAFEMLSALDHLHRRGFVHRDIKPANTLLTERGVVLIDFDMAKRYVEEQGDSGEFDLERCLHPGARSTGITGTPLYMSPDRIQGGDNLPLGDLYAVALVLFKMLTQRLPSDYGVPPKCLRELMVLRGSYVPSLKELGVDLPQELDAFLRRSLSPTPLERPASALDMADELATVLQVHG